MLGMHGSVLREHGRAPLGLPDRGRRPLRRPRHRQRRRVRAAREDHPHRHRPVVDLEEHQGRTSRSSATASACSRKLVEAVREELQARRCPPPRARARKQWAAQVAEWKRDFPFQYDWDDDVIKPQYVMQEIRNQTHGEALIVTGVGQHQMWAAQYYRFKHPRALVHLGRARHDGLRAADRHGRAGRAIPASSSSTSTATARSR